jgi:hypothetical protein
MQALDPALGTVKYMGITLQLGLFERELRYQQRNLHLVTKAKTRYKPNQDAKSRCGYKTNALL